MLTVDGVHIDSGMKPLVLSIAVGRLARVYQMKVLGLRRRTVMTTEEALVVVSDD